MRIAANYVQVRHDRIAAYLHAVTLRTLMKTYCTYSISLGKR